VDPYGSGGLGGIYAGEGGYGGGGGGSSTPTYVGSMPPGGGGGASGIQSLVNAFQQSESQAAPVAPGPITNTAAANPDLTQLQQMYKDRYAQLQAGNKPNDDLTNRMMNLASGKINDSAAGAQQQLSENLARRGVAGGGIEDALRGRVVESAQRASAGAREYRRGTRRAGRAASLQ
jgi:hypothetical protein